MQNLRDIHDAVESLIRDRRAAAGNPANAGGIPAPLLCEMGGVLRAEAMTEEEWTAYYAPILDELIEEGH